MGEGLFKLPSRRLLQAFGWLFAIPCGTPDDPHGDKTEVEGIFPAIARLNASCCPNLYHWWDAATQRLYFRAARDIAIGEELCMTYMDALLPRAKRLALIKQHYNYECRCPACKLTDQEGHDSDYRRSTIARIRSQLLEYNDPSYGLHKVSLSHAQSLFLFFFELRFFQR